MSIVDNQKWYCGIIAVIGWFAVVLQLVLMLQNKDAPVGETLVRFFSFFTILTNVLVAVYFTLQCAVVKTHRNQLIFSSAAATAITVYIVVVGLVYNIILRQLWNPQGWQYLVDLLLHTVIPVLTLLYWIFLVKDKSLDYSTAFWWLLYPLLYCVYVLFRGAASNFYPYPFIDVSKLGLQKVIVNSVFLSLLFLVLSLAFIFAGKLLSRQKAHI